MSSQFSFLIPQVKTGTALYTFLTGSFFFCRWHDKRISFSFATFKIRCEELKWKTKLHRLHFNSARMEMNMKRNLKGRKKIVLKALSNKWIVIAEIRFMSPFKVNQVMCIGWKIRLLLNVIKTEVLRRASHSQFLLYQPRRSISWKGIRRGEWAKDQTKE